MFQVYDAGPMFCFAFVGSCFIVLGMVSNLLLIYLVYVTNAHVFTLNFI